MKVINVILLQESFQKGLSQSLVGSGKHYVIRFIHNVNIFDAFEEVLDIIIHVQRTQVRRQRPSLSQTLSHEEHFVIRRSLDKMFEVRKNDCNRILNHFYSRRNHDFV